MPRSVRDSIRPGGDTATALVISSCHFVQHLFRILPALIPILAIHFEYPLWQLGSLVTVYYLGSGLAQAPMGVLVDRADPRWILPPGIVLMGLGYFVFAVSPVLGAHLPAGVAPGRTFDPTYIVSVLGVFLSGLGAAVIHPAGYALLAINVHPDARGRALGVWGSVAKLGDAAAPVTIAILVLALLWDQILTLFAVGGVLYGVGLFFLMGRPWFSTVPDVGRGVESANDAIDTVETDRRDYWYPLIVMYAFQMVRAFSEKGVKSFLPLFLVVVYGYTFTAFGRTIPPESLANFYFTALFIVAAVVLLGTGYLVDEYDHRKVLVGYLVVSAVTLLVLTTGLLSPLALLAVLLVFGAAFWGLTAARDAIVSDISPADRQGRAFGYLMTLSHLTGAIAPTLVGLIADWIGIRNTFVLLTGFVLLNVVTIGVLFNGNVYRTSAGGPATGTELGAGRE